MSANMEHPYRNYRAPEPAELFTLQAQDEIMTEKRRRIAIAVAEGLMRPDRLQSFIEGEPLIVPYDISSLKIFSDLGESTKAMRFVSESASIGITAAFNCCDCDELAGVITHGSEHRIGVHHLQHEENPDFVTVTITYDGEADEE